MLTLRSLRKTASRHTRRADNGERMARHLFLVSHHEAGLYEYLLDRFRGDGNVEVILDRRREERRRRSEHPGPERRRVDRRKRREIDLELLLRSHVILTLPNGPSPQS
jgi:hypothetical protein